MNNKEKADYVVFIGNKKFDCGPIEEKLKQLIECELDVLEDMERKEILGEIKIALGKEHFTDVVDPEEGVGFLISPQEWHWLAKHKQDKWLEYIIYRYKFKVYPNQYKLSKTPLYILIEPSSACNLRCPMCFQSDPSFQTKEFIGMIPWSLFTNLVDQAKELNCEAITLASRGEPLLHKDFGKMLHYLDKAGILDVKINTNATGLTERITHDILSSNVSEVVFSIDAATKELYESIRRGANFERVLNNIKKFKEIKDKDYSNSPTITRISGVKVKPEQNVSKISEFWSEMVDEVTIQSAIPRWDSYNNEINDSKEPCRMIWRQMYIWYDGTVNPCDFDYKSYLSVGNAYKNSLQEIWLGEKFSKLRENHLNKERGKHVPCDRCPLN